MVLVVVVLVEEVVLTVSSVITDANTSSIYVCLTAAQDQFCGLDYDSSLQAQSCSARRVLEGATLSAADQRGGRAHGN